MTTFYWVLLGFLDLLDFHLVLPGFTGFYWVLLGFTGFTVFSGFYGVLLGFSGFDGVLLGFSGFYWVLLGFTGSTVPASRCFYRRRLIGRRTMEGRVGTESTRVHYRLIPRVNGAQTSTKPGPAPCPAPFLVSPHVRPLMK